MRPTRELGPRPILSLGLGGAIGGGSAGADPFEQYLMTTEGDQVRQYDLGSLGATATIDPSNGNEQYGELTDDTVITLDAADTTRDGAPSGALIMLWLTQDGLGPWSPDFDASLSGSVTWEGGSTPTWPTTGTFRVIFQRVPGSTNDWVGALVGSGSGSALTVEDEGSPLTTAADTLDFVGGGVTASGSGSTKTITIPGGSSASDPYIWRPVMDGTGAVVVDGGTGEALMAYGPA